MITVVKYDSEPCERIKEILTNLNADFKISTNEADICGADKIILPDGQDMRVIFWKLHLLNLYSLLKMIRKPVLGIGSGMFLMCEHLGVDNICGLGMLPIDAKNNNTPNEIQTKKKISIKDNSKILQNIKANPKFIFRQIIELPLTNFTTSTMHINNLECTASLEKDNRYGVQFIPELSGEDGIQIFKNFIDL